MVPVRNQIYSSTSFIGTSVFLDLTAPVNGADHRSTGQAPYLNQVSVHKHHTPQHAVPVQSTYLTGPSAGRNGLAPPANGSIYHFSQMNPHQVSH